MDDTLMQDSRCVKCTDHLGNTYSSMTEMCNAYNIQLDTFMKRISRGSSLEQALTKPVHPRTVYESMKKSKLKQKRCIIDPDGNTFNSITEMCSYWGIGVSTYRQRIKNNVPMKVALTAPTTSHPNGYIDHMGNHFESMDDMCAYWSVNPITYKCRINSGLSVKDALTKPKYSRNLMEIQCYIYKILYLGQAYLVYARNSAEASQKWHIYKGFMSQQPGITIIKLESGTELHDSYIAIQ